MIVDEASPHRQEPLRTLLAQCSNNSLPTLALKQRRRRLDLCTTTVKTSPPVDSLKTVASLLWFQDASGCYLLKALFVLVLKLGCCATHSLCELSVASQPRLLRRLEE